MIITSLQNPNIKNLIKLSTKKRERQKQGKFVVEGVQENEYALSNGFVPIAFYIEENYWKNQIELPQTPQFFVSNEVYKKIAYRGSTEGLIGIYELTHHEIDWNRSKLIVLLENIEKPGNLGAILRSSLAFGVDAIVLTGTSLDIFNPNVIRSSVGTIFTIPAVSLNNESAYLKLKEQGFEIYGTDMHEKAIELEKVLFGDKSALLFGNEHEGISEFWNDKLNENYLIPMQNNIDSLNLSNAVAISLYQYRVQKKPIA